MGAMRTKVLTSVAVGLVAVCGFGCVWLNRVFQPVDGDAMAQDVAEEQAQRLNARLGYRNRPGGAESIAATEVKADQRAGASPQATQVVPLAWAGRVYADEQATIDVRFTVTVTEYHPAAFGARGNSAGSATRCYRYTLRLYRDTAHTGIRCPAIATAAVPSAAPVLRLPGDASDRLAAALRTATPATLASTVRAAFPQEGFTVDTATAGDTLVAAVGVPAQRDCVVMIRTADGATSAVGFDPVQLEPGETGCRTALYTHPVR
ncbi:hypothetical protein OHA72_34305 [Dactylosporangium sp. NBC_01737]|uniref:hypothetical protein n=1 Tax=Dactylosporangium sp. NBC_01737 TaxID=2975959 RepID=UPI002E13D262|nr:hypothetical protein OHA72_34305 [Dactylosporangium sp. NBC_01737]